MRQVMRRVRSDFLFGRSGLEERKRALWSRDRSAPIFFRRKSTTPLFRDAVTSEVWPEYLRNLDGTVGLLVVLYYLTQDARHRERGVIE